MPILVTLQSHNVAGSTVILLAQTVSKLALTHDKLVRKTFVLLIFPLTARSILAVGATFISVGCVKYNALLSLFCIVVTFVAWLPPSYLLTLKPVSFMLLHV